ncbi:hypothetical protein A3F66_03300 [candidate division TM6 bacterium RIFCSPHIGHO2_12_FULL_32_22]|nr:MAG: hypothetical protein A3F66_03300 [candidate division TM6 bacterium RIFCSPHIGHO2_12_FULL_32_22]
MKNLLIFILINFFNLHCADKPEIQKRLEEKERRRAICLQKKQLLARLVPQYQQIGQQIEQLEREIAELDPQDSPRAEALPMEETLIQTSPPLPARSPRRFNSESSNELLKFAALQSARRRGSPECE